jgi:outer membrane lipoprotein carrier protein
MINIISLLLLFTVGLNYFAVDDKLLKNLQDKFDEVKDLSAEFKQSTNGKAVVSGKFFFKKEDKLRIEFKNSILISDGSINWSYNQKEHKVIISKNDDSNASPFSLRKVIFDYPKECMLSSEMENGIEVLVLTPNEESSIGYSVIKIWINNENLINRIILKDRADNLIQIDFSKYKVNQKIAESKFSFTPPEGSKVIDLR